MNRKTFFRIFAIAGLAFIAAMTLFALYYGRPLEAVAIMGVASLFLWMVMGRKNL